VVSTRDADAPLTLADWTPLAKVLIRAAPGGQVARALGVPFGRAGRDGDGTLVVGSGPGEWLLLAAPGGARTLVEHWRGVADDGLVSVVDITSGRALMCLVGTRSPELLAKVCALDLGVAPDGTAFRTSVAGVVAEVVRNDACSYLLACDRSFGQYLFDALLDAGREFSIAITGYKRPGIPGGGLTASE
jgi:sarcosine oxidase subunit alpha